jgi:uncharacterized protein (TIGR00251 family)
MNFMLTPSLKRFNQGGQIYLRVKARPNAVVTAVKQVLADGDGQILKIDVAAPAARGRANLELVRFLAALFGAAKENVKIISGAGERMKLVKIIK